MEPEFRRFEQGSISANTAPEIVKNYLERSTKKYRQHTSAYLNANRKNHPEAIKEYEKAFEYSPDSKVDAPAPRTVVRTGKDKSGRKVVQYSDGGIEYVE
jgi:hypothetical protein